MQDAKESALRKSTEGMACFLKSDFDEAVTNFSEGILMLPKLDIYAKEMKQLYWQRAECYLRKVNGPIDHFTVVAQ